MNELMDLFLSNISYNNRMDTQKLCLAYTKDTLNIPNKVYNIIPILYPITYIIKIYIYIYKVVMYMNSYH